MDLTFVHPARISPRQFRAVLESYHSPAAPQADALYLVCTQRGLDPAVALAFFVHESSCGTKGAAVRTKNWGNIRKGQGNEIVTKGGWAYYQNWASGLADWCALIKGKYVALWKLDTVGKALPKYAPQSDHNVPHRYAAAVCRMVGEWQAADQAAGTGVAPAEQAV